MSFVERPSLAAWYRGSLPPGSRTPLQLVMIQSTSFCNIDCAYCYLPLRSDKSRFDLERLPELIRKLDDAGLVDRELSFAWHAGEPLVLPVDWYRRAFAIIDAHLPAGVSARHAFQTNAILLSDEYARFFRETGASVGVSIDGPREIHDARRLTRDGKGTFDRGIAGIKRLQDGGIPFTTISVVSADSLDRADEIYEFFKGLGPIIAGFNIEEIEGEHRDSSLAGQAMEEKVRAFYRQLAQRARTDPNPLRIREFENGRGAALGAMAGAAGGSSENNPLSIISVDTKGRVSTYSPELLQVPGETDTYTFGSIDDIDFTKLWSNNHFATVDADIRRGVEMCRASCTYFNACHGGAPANKLAENGTFASAETMHCRLTKKALIDVMEEDLLDQLQRRVAVRAVPPINPGASVPAQNSAPSSLAKQSHRPTRIVGGAKPTVAPSQNLRLATQARRVDLPAGSLPGGEPSFRAEPVESRPALDKLFPHIGTINIFAPTSRLAVSNGTQQAPDGYKQSARVPRPHWWHLTDIEGSALRSPARSPGALNYAALIRLPDALRELALRLGVQASVNAAGPVAGGSLEEALATGIRNLLQPGSKEQILGTLVQSGGLLTSTLDPADRTRQGLHVDSWSRRTLSDRATAPNRIAVNCGARARRLLLLDISVGQVAGLMGRAEHENPTDVARDFLALHPTYPVLSLEVRPGEAYVAATENLIHDGSSLGNKEPDVTFTMIGEFNRSAIAAHIVQEARTAAR